MIAIEAPPVARKKSKTSESRRYNTLVRMDDEMMIAARKVAALRGISVAEYFAEVLRPIVKRDLAKEARKLADEQEGHD